MLTPRLWQLLTFVLCSECGSPQCPSCAVSFDQMNKCFEVFTMPQPFITAEQKCVDLGGHLASVQNAFENAFVVRKYRG